LSVYIPEIFISNHTQNHAGTERKKCLIFSSLTFAVVYLIEDIVFNSGGKWVSIG